jgi:hypothetical protein
MLALIVLVSAFPFCYVYSTLFTTFGATEWYSRFVGLVALILFATLVLVILY